MIKASELRIGNVFMVGGIDRMVFVSAIFKTHFRCEDKDRISFEESIRVNYFPVGLSEEILLKVGFEHRSFYVIGAGNSFKWQIGKFILLKNFEGKFYVPTNESIVLESLHQLQNVFYFMNNGKELNTSGLI